jgi:membrane protease YdiL (CAAX protease family)
MDELDLAHRAAVGLALVAAGLAAAPVLVFAARRLVPERRVFFARWGFSHLGLALAVFLLLGGLLPHAVRWVLPEGGFLVSLAASQLLLACVAVPVLVWAWRLHPEGVRALGLRRGGNLAAIGLGGLAYVAMLPLIIGCMWVWSWVFVEVLGGEARIQGVAEGIRALEGAELGVVLALAIVVGPFLEELLFRGFLQPLLVQNLREKGGVVVTALVFSLAHGEGGLAFLPLFALGVLLGAVYLRTQRLSACIFVHAVHNAANVLLLLAAENSGVLEQALL